MMLIWCIDNARETSYNNKKGGINMANISVTMRIDEQLKIQLQELMANLGLDMTTFFTMAAKQAVREQALPFRPNMDCVPNKETLQAMGEVEYLKAHPEAGKRYNDVDAMMEDLLS